MANGIGVSLNVLTAPVTAEFERINRSADRATMWALRTGGRKVQSYAKKAVPVYRGPARKWYQGGAAGGDIIPGELKKSIRNGRRLGKSGPSGYSLKVGPRGPHVHLYAARVESRTPYMAPAIERVAGEFKGIAESAWGRAIQAK